MAVGQEWREGWTVVLASAMGVGMAAASAYSLGAFMSPLHNDFGWTRAEIAIAISISSIVTALTAPFVGHMVDRLGARRLALIGTVFTCAAFSLLSTLEGSIEIYWAHWFLISIGLTLSSPVIWTSAVVTRFRESRGLALSVTLCGTNIAGAVAPLLTTALILHFGWREAYWGLALYMLVTALPLALAFFYDARDLDKRSKAGKTERESFAADQLKSGLSLGEAARTPRFWLIAVSFLFGGGAVVSLLVHLIPLLEERGLTPMMAAAAASAMSIAAVCGRITSGFLLDRIFAPRIALAAFTFPVVACIGLSVLPPSDLLSFAAAVFFGLALGAEYNFVSFLCARYFGLKAYGVIYGVMFGAFGVGQAVLPWLIGRIYDFDGSYHTAVMVLGTTFLTSAILLQFLGPYPVWSGSDPKPNEAPSKTGAVSEPQSQPT